MSRIGKLPINVPSGVEVTIEGDFVKIKGQKGELSRTIHSSMGLKKEGAVLTVVPADSLKPLSNFHGLTRSLVNNMVVGVSEGYTKSLLLKGVGYRAAAQGTQLNLTLGYSHPVVFDIPKGIDIKVEKQTTLVISGSDKELVGQVAATIRAYRKPEPYHGKGIRYSDEVIITKVGKSGAKK